MSARSVLGLVVMLGCGGQSAAAGSPGATPSAAPQDDRHEIHLHRDRRAGDRAHVTFRAQSETMQRLTLEGEVVSDEVERLDIVFVADALIEEVNARGKAIRTQLRSSFQEMEPSLSSMAS